MGSHGIVGSSDGTEERENSSINMFSEGVNLKDSFSHSCFSYILNAITSISVTCILLFSCPLLNMSFFYFSSLIQPSLEEDVSTEILLANTKLVNCLERV